MKRLDCCVVVKVKVAEKVEKKNLMNVHLDDFSSTAEPSVTKLAMVIHQHGPKCHAGSSGS